jgi:glycyl-tRNA synthetase alpha chain
MYVLGFDDGNLMPYNDSQTPIPLTYGDVFREAEAQYARWNFDVADTATLGRHFEDAEAECRRIVMAQPAYDQCIKASHLFNLLDARGVISVTERQAYIGRVRALAKACADAYLLTPAGGFAAS